MEPRTMDDRLRHALRAEDVGETDQSDHADVRMMRGNETARSNCRI
jgi:hypothetical protein